MVDFIKLIGVAWFYILLFTFIPAFLTGIVTHHILQYRWHFILKALCIAAIGGLLAGLGAFIVILWEEGWHAFSYIHEVFYACAAIGAGLAAAFMLIRIFWLHFYQKGKSVDSAADYLKTAFFFGLIPAPLITLGLIALVL